MFAVVFSASACIRSPEQANGETQVNTHERIVLFAVSAVLNQEGPTQSMALAASAVRITTIASKTPLDRGVGG